MISSPSPKQTAAHPQPRNTSAPTWKSLRKIMYGGIPQALEGAAVGLSCGVWGLCPVLAFGLSIVRGCWRQEVALRGSRPLFLLFCLCFLWLLFRCSCFVSFIVICFRVLVCCSVLVWCCVVVVCCLIVVAICFCPFMGLCAIWDAYDTYPGNIMAL